MTSPPLYRLDRVTSTLDLIHDHAARGAPGGTAVVAREQREGRGTRGRAWRSPKGGLWLSILYREVSEPGLEFLSLRIGLAVVTAIESTIPGLRLGLKWPNDVMLGDRKAGGVLCEARWQGAQLGWVGVGVGINVVNPIPEELKDSAVALATAGATNVEELVAPVVTRLRELRLDVTAMPPEELAEFRGRDWLQGRPLTEPVAGIARGIAADGALLVEGVDGSMVSAKAGRVISD